MSCLDHDAIGAILRQPCTRENGWHFHSQSALVQLYTKTLHLPNGEQRLCSKGVAVFPVPAEVLAAVADDYSKTEDYFESSRCVQRHDAFNSVQYTSFKSVLGTKRRDFVLSSRRQLHSAHGDIVLSGRSVEWPGVPERATHVRGMLYLGGFCIQRLTSTSCRCYYGACFDPRGWRLSTRFTANCGNQPRGSKQAP